MWLKKFLIASAIVVAAVIIALIVFLNIYDFNAFRPEIEQSVLEATGRRLSIRGDLKIELDFSPALSINDIAVANAAWATRPHMATIGEVEVEIALLPLLSGTVALKRLIVNDLDLWIEKGPNGQYNFDLDLPESEPKQSSSSNRLKINAVLLNKVSVTYIDEPSGTGHTAVIDTLAATFGSPSGRIQIESEGVFNAIPFRLNARSQLPWTTTATDPALPLELDLIVADATLRIDGTIGNAADRIGIALRLKASGGSVARLAALADVKDLPDPGPFVLEAAVRGSVSELAVRDLKIDIGDAKQVRLLVRGSIDDLVEIAGIKLDFSLRSDDVRGFETVLNMTLPWDGIIDASGRLDAVSVNKIDFADLDFQVADDRIEGALTLDRTSSKPLVTGRITVHRLDLKPVFRTGAFDPLQQENIAKTGVRPDRSDGPAQTVRIEDILNALDGRLTLRVDELLLPGMSFGRFDAQTDLSDGRVRITMKGAALPDIEELSGVAHLPELGPFELSGNLAANADTLRLYDTALTAGSLQEARIDISGAIADLTKAHGFDFDLKLEGEEAARLEKYLIKPWFLQGPYMVTGKMSNDQNAGLSFKNIVGDLHGFGFKGAVDVDWSGTDTLVAVDVAAGRFNLKPLRLSGKPVPPALLRPSDLGPLRAMANLSVQEDRTALQRFTIRAGTAALARLNLQGTVANLGTMQGADLFFTASGADAANLEDLIGQPLPVHGAFDAAAAIQMQRPGKFQFSDINLTLAGSKVAGNLDLDVTDGRFELDADLNSPGFDANQLLPDPEPEKTESGLKAYVSETMGRNQRLLPDIALPFNIPDNAIMDIRLKARKMVVSTINIEGLRTGIKYGGGRFDIDAKSRALSFGSEKGILEEFSTIGAFEVQLKARIVAEEIRIYSVRLNAGTPQTVALRLDGSIEDVTGLRGVSVDFSARGNDAGFLSRLLEKDFRITGPFSFSGQMRDPVYKDFRLENLTLAIADSDLNGHLDIDLRNRRPGLKARFESRQLDLRPFLPEFTLEDLKETPPPEKPTSPTAQRPQKVFSSEPIELEGLSLIDADVQVDIDQLYTPRAAMQDVDFHLMLKDGNLTLKPVRFVSGNGKVDADVFVTQQTNHPRLRARIDIQDSELGKFMDDLDLKREIEGPLDFNLNVEGPADSMAGLMGGLNGTVNLYMRQGRVNNRFIGLIYTDLGTTMLNLIKPISQKDPMINLNCFVLSFEIKEGQAKHAGLMDTNQTSLISAGIIDLKKEQLDIVLKSNPKQRLRIRGVGSIGISLKELAKPFKLGGSLANPSLVVDPSQSAATVGKLVGGFALLGPLGIAVALTDFSPEDMPPCERAEQMFQQGTNPGLQDPPPAKSEKQK